MISRLIAPFQSAEAKILFAGDIEALCQLLAPNPDWVEKVPPAGPRGDAR